MTTVMTMPNTRPIVPVSQLAPRIPDAGRLRFGRKVKSGGKERPQAIATWRLTSHDEEAIRQLAAIYGGTPQPWTDAPTPGQWEVFTEASELRVVLPPDPLGGTPIYELWSGGGCQRRCDGVMCQTIVTGPDGGELADVPCICSEKGVLACAVKTRLSVVLPEVKFAGVWRLDSGSWNVAHEFPGMVAMIQQLQARGMTRALLGLEHRKVVTAGQTKRFIMPTLRVGVSPDAMLEGAASVAALSSGPVAPAPPAAQLEASTGLPDDDDVVDGELVHNGDEAEPESGVSGASAPESDVPDAKLLRRFHAALRDAFAIPDYVEHKTDEFNAAKAALLAEYRVESSKDLPPETLKRIIEACRTQPAKVREVAGLPAVWGEGPPT